MCNLFRIIWGNFFIGVILFELGNLKNLIYLNLNKNKFYGGFFLEFGKFSKL